MKGNRKRQMASKHHNWTTATVKARKYWGNTLRMLNRNCPLRMLCPAKSVHKNQGQAFETFKQCIIQKPWQKRNSKGCVSYRRMLPDGRRLREGVKSKDRPAEYEYQEVKEDPPGNFMLSRLGLAYPEPARGTGLKAQGQSSL